MLHPHTVFELLGYFVGFRLYLRLRRRSVDVIGGRDRWSLLAAAVTRRGDRQPCPVLAGGSAATLARFDDPLYLVGGKTVVGGLLGGWMAIELTKRLLGIRRRTGDVFAIPLAVGIAIGRIGCFLTGPSDLTWGVSTAAPWAIDAG